tara:strand:+ start:59 stop:313 length:255 start_codon:yes stop_codon:yes gene_type:complete
MSRARELPKLVSPQKSADGLDIIVKDVSANNVAAASISVTNAVSAANVDVSGTVTAASFSGDGSNLTNAGISTGKAIAMSIVFG